MQVLIDKEIHEIIYIEYQNGFPHDVKTICFIETSKKPYWRLYDWDFFLNNGDNDDLRHYSSGSGGGPKDIHAPQFIDGYTGKIWIRSDVKLKGRGSNFKILKHPIKLKMFYSDSKTINPFLASEETYSYEYCEKCEHYSTEFCTEHKYDDEYGNAKWISDDSSAE